MLWLQICFLIGWLFFFNVKMQEVSIIYTGSCVVCMDSFNSKENFFFSQFEALYKANWIQLGNSAKCVLVLKISANKCWNTEGSDWFKQTKWRRTEKEN